MRRLLVVSLLILSTTLFSCSGDENGSGKGLTFKTSSRTIILPGEDTSCEALNGTEVTRDVPEWRLAINDIQLTWEMTGEDLTVVFIKIEIEHPNIEGGKYVASASGLELDFLLGTVNGFAGSATLTNAGAVTNVVMNNDAVQFLPTTTLSGTSKRPCRFVAGSIGLVDESTNFVTNGRLTVVGVAQGNNKATDAIASGEDALPEGEERSLRITKSIKVEFNFN